VNSVELDDQAAHWVAAYRHAQEQEKHWAEMKQQAREHLEERLGDADTGLIDGTPTVRWSEVVSNRLDTAKLKTSEPDLYAAYLKPSISRRFSLVDPA
jgi:predicted phage-related endonuclease